METAQSDVDLMVVEKATVEQVVSRLTIVEKGIGRSINPTVYSVTEFKSKLAADNYFLTSVLKGRESLYQNAFGKAPSLNIIRGQRKNSVAFRCLFCAYKIKEWATRMPLKRVGVPGGI